MGPLPVGCCTLTAWAPFQLGLHSHQQVSKLVNTLRGRAPALGKAADSAEEKMGTKMGMIFHTVHVLNSEKGTCSVDQPVPTTGKIH